MLRGNGIIPWRQLLNFDYVVKIIASKHASLIFCEAATNGMNKPWQCFTEPTTKSISLQISKSFKSSCFLLCFPTCPLRCSGAAHRTICYIRLYLNSIFLLTDWMLVRAGENVLEDHWFFLVDDSLQVSKWVCIAFLISIVAGSPKI